MEFLVKQRSVGYNEVIQSGNRCCSCSRSLYIFTCGWGNAICNRCMCVTSIRCCSCLSAERYVCGYRIKACLIMSSTRVLVFFQRAGICIGNVSCKVVHIVDRISVFRNFIDHMMDLCKSLNLFFGRFQSHNCLKDCFCGIGINCHACILHSFQDHFCHIRNGLLVKSLIIVPCQSLFILFHGNFLIFIDKFTDRIQRICHVRDTESLRTCEVIDCSTFLYGKSSADTVIYHAGFIWKRNSLCMSHIDGIVCIDHKGNTVFHLFLICIKEFFEGCHLCDIAGLDSDQFAFIHTIRKYKFQRAAHIKECSVMPSVCLTGFLRFYASDDVVFSGIFKSKSSVLQCRDNNFIIIISRKSDTCSGKLSCLDQQFMRRTVPYTDGKRRHREVYMHGCKDTHYGKVVRHIVSVFILSADDQVLEKAVSCKSFCGCCITNFIQVIQFNPDAVEKFLCRFSGDNTFFNISFIIRIHILVKTSR